jgi:hypothetical protein
LQIMDDTDLFSGSGKQICHNQKKQRWGKY